LAYDFRRELQIDLVDYASGERAWTEFYEFVQELPPWGKFKSALALDMDFAKEMKARLDKQLEEREGLEEEEPEIIRKDNTMRSPEGYTPELAMMHLIDERLQSHISVALGAAGMKSPPQVIQHKRPLVAMDILELESEREEIMELKELFGIR